MRVRPGTVNGTVDAPASKSATHRAFTLALLADHSVIEKPLLSADPLSTLHCVSLMGGRVERDDANDRVVIEGGDLRAADDVLDCGNSGTTLRLFTAIAALPFEHTVLTGDASLRRRPMQPLLDALRGLGADAFSTRGNGCAPLVVRGPLRPGETFLPGDVSSQFVSAILLGATQTPGETVLNITSPLKSRPYVNVTANVLEAFGGHVEEGKDHYRVEGQQELPGCTYRVPGDWSTAAFPLVAAAVTGGTVTVRNLDLDDPQGDKAILQVLEEFGARVTASGDGTVTVEGGDLEGRAVDLRDTPDMFPALCALGVHAKGTTTLTGAAHLRFKESDRIAAMVENLRRMGADIEEREDGAVIRGGKPLSGARLTTHHDHRILMAGAVAALAAEGETVLDEAESYRVSYPDFVADFQRLGIPVEVAE